MNVAVVYSSLHIFIQIHIFKLISQFMSTHAHTELLHQLIIQYRLEGRKCYTWTESELKWVLRLFGMTHCNRYIWICFSACIFLHALQPTMPICGDACIVKWCMIECLFLQSSVHEREGGREFGMYLGWLRCGGTPHCRVWLSAKLLCYQGNMLQSCIQRE